MSGALVISLDFELHWGVRDRMSVADYRENLEGTRAAVRETLALFRHHGVRATWASVGLVLCEGRKDAEAMAPSLRPNYRDSRLDPYREFPSLGASEEEDPCHFAPSLGRAVAETPGQELATHTFSHYYTCAEGSDTDSFREDLLVSKKILERYGAEMQSIVFPRNQYADEFLKVCRELGIRTFRSNEDSPLYDFSTDRAITPLFRGLRLLDAHLPVAKTTTAGRERRDFPIADSPSSRFLRPEQDLQSIGRSLRLRRILSGMREAAKAEQVFHLWWHPHNFGKNLDVNLAHLDEVLRHYRVLSSQYGFQSKNMADLYEAERAA